MVILSILRVNKRLKAHWVRALVHPLTLSEGTNQKSRKLINLLIS